MIAFEKIIAVMLGVTGYSDECGGSIIVTLYGISFSKFAILKYSELIVFAKADAIEEFFEVANCLYVEADNFI